MPAPTRRLHPRSPVVLAALLVVACGPQTSQESGGTADGGGTVDGGTVESDDASQTADETGTPSTACGADQSGTIPGTPGPSGFPPQGCNPRSDPGFDGYRCCSDDPAAVGGALPAYEGKNIPGDTPYFSEANNDISTSGQCVRVADLAGQGLLTGDVEGCPIPCNPTWGDGEIETVCGTGRQCCQTRELQAADCVMDLATGQWRPVTGEDIGTLTTWSPAQHATHQDPNGDGCLGLAGGNSSSPEFQDCVRQLGVADQRGLCMALGVGQTCPLALPTYVDACEQLNAG